MSTAAKWGTDTIEIVFNSSLLSLKSRSDFLFILQLVISQVFLLKTIKLKQKTIKIGIWVVLGKQELYSYGIYVNRATQHSKLEPDLQITLLERLRPSLELVIRWRSPSAHTSVGRLTEKQVLNNPHSFTKKKVQHIFFCCAFGYCKCCTSFKINLLPQSLNTLFFVAQCVKQCELRTPGWRSSNRLCGNDRTSFQAISALLWNYSTQIQHVFSNRYELLVEKSNLKGQVQRKSNTINRNDFQI